MRKKEEETGKKDKGRREEEEHNHGYKFQANLDFTTVAECILDTNIQIHATT